MHDSKRADTSSCATLAGSLALSACQLLLPVASGMLLAASFPPLGLWWLVLVALVPLAWSVAISPRLLEPLAGGLLGGATFYLLSLDWIRTCYDSSGLSGPWAFAWLLTALAASPTWCITLAIAHVLYWRFSTTLAVALGLGWIVGDFARRAIAVALTGMDFPWLQLAAPLTVCAILVQAADLVGATGVGGIVAFVNGSVCEVLVARAKRTKLRAGLAAAGVLTAVVVYGAWRSSERAFPAGPTIALMPPQSVSDVFGSRSPPTPRADMLLWPEGALQDDSASDADRLDQLHKFARTAGTIVAMGWYRKRPSFTANSLAIVHPRDGLIDNYQKTYLVPWSESASRVDFANTELKERAVDRQAKYLTFECNGAHVAPAICYDACFPGLYRRRNSPDLFIVCSAEAADQRNLMQEHILQMIRLRAIEFRRPIVRNVRGGHSGIIDSCGRLRVDVTDFDEPVLVGPVPLDDRTSVYAAIGDTILAIPFVLFAGVGFYRRQRCQKDRRPSRIARDVRVYHASIFGPLHLLAALKPVS